MEIKLLGNCSVLLKSKKSQIMLDPYFSNNGNLLYKRTTNVSTYYKEIEHLDAILLSHSHFDHMDIKFLNKFKDKCTIYSPKLSLNTLMFKSRWIKKGQEFVVGDFSITVVQANHICPAVGYIIKAEGVTIYFAGDTYYGKFMKDISRENAIDIAMLPITHYLPPMTMGESGALKSLRDLTPKIMIPIHQDIAQRLPFTSTKVSIGRLRDKISNENLQTQLIHLKNGECFNTDIN
ncbi:MAG: MBL fold metallo-hydrolase [Clostridiaceae bacterium]